MKGVCLIVTKVEEHPPAPPFMNDDELHRILCRATARNSLPDTFNREVWHRIEAEESISLGACIRQLCQRFFTLLTRPCPGGAAILASMALGAWLGVQAAEPPLDGASAYIRSIDPLMSPPKEARP